MKIAVEGITLKSRSGNELEFNVLRAIVFDLNEASREKVISIFCDSNATTYTVVLRSFDLETAEYIARQVEFSLWRSVGGFNGITIDGGEHIGVDLPLYARWPGYPARHYTIPGEWRDDINIAGVHELLFKIREKWPVVFSADRPVPLKIGIFDDVVAAFPDNHPIEIKMALGFHCRAERYLKALIERLPRVDLKFKTVGRVTPEQVAIAKRQLGYVIEEIAP